MKKNTLFCFIFWVLLFSCNTVTPSDTPKQNHPFVFFNTLQEGQKNAAMMKRRMSVLIYKEGMSLKEAAKKTGFTDSESHIRYFKKDVINVALPENNPEAQSLIQKYQLKYIPVVLYFSLSGNYESKVYGATFKDQPGAAEANEALFAIFQSGSKDPELMHDLIRAPLGEDRHLQVVDAYFDQLPLKTLGDWAHQRMICFDVRTPFAKVVDFLMAHEKEINVLWAENTINNKTPCVTVKDALIELAAENLKTAAKTKNNKLFERSLALAKKYPDSFIWNTGRIAEYSLLYYWATGDEKKAAENALSYFEKNTKWYYSASPDRLWIGANSVAHTYKDRNALAKALTWIEVYNEKPDNRFKTKGLYLQKKLAEETDNPPKKEQAEKGLATILKEFEKFIAEFPPVNYPLKLNQWVKRKMDPPFSSSPLYKLLSLSGNLFATRLNKPIALLQKNDQEIIIIWAQILRPNLIGGDEVTFAKATFLPDGTLVKNESLAKDTVITQ